MLRFNTVILILMFCVPTGCEVEFKSQDIDGQMLTDLGKQLNKTLLTIIGTAMTNYHQCGAWSQWTSCSATTRDVFGIKTRNRSCGLDSSRRTETDIAFCAGSCPKDYNMTTNGFCLKLYKTRKSYDDAETTCKSDGGFLLNVDSDEKYEDVKAIISSADVTVYTIHLNGRRQNSTSPWEYTYGSTRGYFKWSDGQPTSIATYHCLYMVGMKTPRFHWYNHKCENENEFVCEIVV